MSSNQGSVFDRALDWLGRRLARRLRSQSSGYQPYTPSDFPTLCRTLQPGDVLLIEGNERISGAIKYLTQSTWSHVAFYAGDGTLVEADLVEGVVRSISNINGVLGRNPLAPPRSLTRR